MEIHPPRATVRGPEEWFTGEVWYEVISEGPSRVRANLVRFAPGARSAWHAHARGQTLFVTEGLGYVQARGGHVIEIHPGDTVETDPGEWHWHGAAPDRFMAHIAVWEHPAEGAAIQWGDRVSEREYLGLSPGDAR